MASSSSFSGPSEVVINNVSYNTTTLSRWGYSYYRNGTLSNDTSCWVVFDRYKPTLNDDGTWTGAISCYDPIHGIKSRGALGLLFGCLYIATIILTVVNLRKAGFNSRRLGLRRRDALNRRWQWYWLILSAVCGLLSAFTGMDVDRDHVLNTPIVLQAIFFVFSKPLLLAALWEAVKNWIKQYRHGHLDEMSKFESARFTSGRVLYFSVLFYALDVVSLVIEIARSWTPIELQRSPQQAEAIAKPVATDLRFKISSFLYLGLFSAVCVMAPRNRSMVDRSIWFLVVGMLSLSVLLGYAVAASFDWMISPFNVSISLGWLFGMNYSPALLTIILLNCYGLVGGKYTGNGEMSVEKKDSTENKQLVKGIRQGFTTINQKFRNSNDGYSVQSYRDDPTLRGTFEMRALPVQHYKDAATHDTQAGSSWFRSKGSTAEHDDLTKPRRSLQSERSRWTAETDHTMRTEDTSMTNRRTRWTEGTATPDGSSISGTSSHTLQAKPQVVRSMLDG